MERYERYKDSGVKWIGEIPEHWEISCLRRILKKYSVKGYADKQLLSVTREKGVILRGAKGDDGNNNIIPEDLSGYKHVKKGQFVINKMKSWQGSYGVSCYEGIVSPAYFVYDLNFEDKRFFSWAIRSKNYVPFFMQYSKGIRVDQWDLTPENVKCIPFFIPPKSEQTAIANYLDSVTSKIDEAISQQQKMIDLLNERKQIIIQNAVTKGLDPNAKMKDSGVEWIGEIPEHWEVIKLKYIFRRIADGTHFSPETIEEGMPYITATNVRGKGIDFNETKKIRQKDYEALVAAGCKPQLNDILLVKDGATTGRVGLMIDDTDCVTLSSVAMLSPQKKYSHLYLMYMMMSDFMQKQIILSMAGSAMPRITLIKLSNFIGIVPPMDEQESIVTYMEKASMPIDSAIKSAEKQIFLLQERKQIIINDVVTGKVKVV